jgi:hypothetical protein
MSHADISVVENTVTTANPKAKRTLNLPGANEPWIRRARNSTETNHAGKAYSSAAHAASAAAK